jgi:hypothetical protein
MFSEKLKKNSAQNDCPLVAEKDGTQGGPQISYNLILWHKNAGLRVQNAYFRGGCD